jgi:hypothetical protein
MAGSPTAMGTRLHVVLGTPPRLRGSPDDVEATQVREREDEVTVALLRRSAVDGLANIGHAIETVLVDHPRPRPREASVVELSSSLLRTCPSLPATTTSRARSILLWCRALRFFVREAFVASVTWVTDQSVDAWARARTRAELD